MNFQKTIIVTGSTSGIGLSIIEKFYEENFNCVIVGKVKSFVIKKIKNRFDKHRVLILNLDLTKIHNVKKLIFLTTKKFKKIDVLVNCAGMQVVESLEKYNESIYLSRNCSSTPEVSRIVIQAGVNSKSTVVIENTGKGEIGEEIEINLSPGASLDLISLQEWDRSAVHIAQHHAIVSKDAQFTSYVVSVGGSVVRISPTVEFTGAGSFADLYGIYFATDGQHLEHRIHVKHNVPNAKSRVNG